MRRRVCPRWRVLRPIRTARCCRSRRGGGLRLLLEAGNLSLAVEPEDAHLSSVLRCDRLRGDRDVGAIFDVRFDEIAEIHPVEMIPGEDQIVLGVVAHEVPRRLPHRVRRALEPRVALGRLFGGQNFHEALGEDVQPVSLGDMAVQRRRVELREHEDPLEPGVETVADRDVDEPIFPAERHRGFRPHVGERKQSGSAASAEDQRQNVVHTSILSNEKLFTRSLQTADRG